MQDYTGNVHCPSEMMNRSNNFRKQSEVCNSTSIFPFHRFTHCKLLTVVVDLKLKAPVFSILSNVSESTF